LINILATEELNNWLSRRSNRWTYDQGLLSPIVRIVCDYIMEREANRTGKRIVGDKSPDSSLDVAIPHLNCIYPDAHVIHIIRDGRDAVLSRRIQLFIDAPGVLDDADLEIRDAFLADREPFLRLERSLFTRRWLENAATRWAGNVRNTHEKGQDLYNDRYFWLRYEDLIGDPSAWLEKVWNFLGAEPATSELTSVIRKTMTENPAVAWQEKQAPEMVKDLKRGIAGGWQEMFTYDDRQLFERIAGEELASWGYEIGDG
jgi:hypothetical protein